MTQGTFDLLEGMRRQPVVRGERQPAGGGRARERDADRQLVVGPGDERGHPRAQARRRGGEVEAPIPHLDLDLVQPDDAVTDAVRDAVDVELRESGPGATDEQAPAPVRLELLDEREIEIAQRRGGIAGARRRRRRSEPVAGVAKRRTDAIKRARGPRQLQLEPLPTATPAAPFKARSRRPPPSRNRSASPRAARPPAAVSK